MKQKDWCGDKYERILQQTDSSNLALSDSIADGLQISSGRLAFLDLKPADSPCQFWTCQPLYTHVSQFLNKLIDYTLIQREKENLNKVSFIEKFYFTTLPHTHTKISSHMMSIVNSSKHLRKK